jgi:hypothetical protein
VSLRDRVEGLRHFASQLTPAQLRRLGRSRVEDVIQRELPRARKRLADLEERYPSADTRELAQRLIDEKKGIASMVGGVSGVFGAVSIPADLVVMLWLELGLLVDIATLYKRNLKSENERGQLLDLFGLTNGVGPFTRSTPRALGSLAGYLLTRGGLNTLGRALPVVAAPVSAWLNNQHIQRVGDAAVRHFQGFEKAHRKTRTVETNR